MTGWFLLGAPWDCSGSGRGEQDAPAALRATGLADVVATDLGDADTAIRSTDRDATSGVLALDDTVRAAHALAAALVAAYRDHPGLRPLVVGGDCSLLLGVFPAVRRRAGAAGLWFVDGHPDYLDGASSDTGETADMDLAVLTGTGAPDLVTLGGGPPMVPAERTVLLGHRTTGLDEASAAELARLPDELHRIDAATLMADPVGAGLRAERRLAGSGDAWLHVDLDVLDSAALPAVTYPQAGGPEWEQVRAALEPLAASQRLLGISVADFRPDLDPTGALAAAVVALVTRLLGAADGGSRR